MKWIFQCSLVELYEKFYVAAYGCNQSCAREIRRVLSARRQADQGVAFYEFFLTQPMPRPKEIQEQDLCQWNGNGWKSEVYVLSPFAPRLAERAAVVPVYENKKLGLSYRTTATLQKMQLKFSWKHSQLVRKAWEDWSNSDPSTEILVKLDPDRQVGVTWKYIEDSSDAKSYRVGLVDGWTLKWQTKQYVKMMDEPSGDKESAILLGGLLQSISAKKDDKILGIFIPIASSRLLYGGIWIMFPGLKKGSLENNRLREAVGLKVSQFVRRTYLPGLAVLHENWLESLCLKEPDGADNTIKVRNVYRWLKEPLTDQKTQHGTEVADDIESLLMQLWKRREPGSTWEKKENQASQGQPTRDDYKDSFIFKEYLVCSESMIRLLHKVVTAAKTLRKSSTTLPACLVVGEAGSGKDKLAKMLRLFSRDYQENGTTKMGYYGGDYYVVNLSAIRPGPITVAMLAGVDPQLIDFKGILHRIREKDSRITAGAGDAPPTLFLDEFNSMDPDSQGVLLRYLDNSEIVALGSLKDAEDVANTNCLVIGIMNEDPAAISREHAMEFFRKGEYLGSFLGDLFYEHFLRVRRLRPDIMYRMIRNGKFIIPNLRDRKEDIPLLFHIFVGKELAVRVGKSSVKLHLPLEVLDRLMGDDLLWPGNVRQLQALAKLVAEDTNSESEGTFILELPALDRALQEVGLLSRMP